VLLALTLLISNSGPPVLAFVGVLVTQAQPYFSENINAGADDVYGPAQLQDRIAAAAAAGSFLADATAAAAATDTTAHDAAEVAAATAAAAAAAGLVPAGPEAATVAAVAAEAASSFLKGTAEARQAAAVALGPEGFAAVLKKVRRIGCAPFWLHWLHPNCEGLQLR
jgi:hypothetical protein